MNNFEEISKKCTSSSIKNIREKFRVEIKKQKNEETFNSKRLKFSNIIEDESNIIKTTKSLFSDQTIMKEIDESFIKKDFIFLLKNIKLIRINSSIEPLHFDEMILSKIVPLLIKICTSKDFSEQHDLIYECTWIISNGLSGNSNVIKYFIEEGVIAALKAQINSEKLEIREQALWAFANIAGDHDSDIKKIMFKENIVDLICDISTTFPLSEEFKSNLSWFIINLACDDYCPVNFKDVEVFLNIIYYLLTSEIEEITVIKQLMGSAYSIVLSAQENNDNLAQILEIHFSFINLILKELIPKYKNQKQILFHSIKVIGLLLTGYDSTVEELINNDVINIYASFLFDSESKIRREVMWGFSNLACCSSEILQNVYDSPFLIQNIFEATLNDEDPKVKKEGLICCANLCGMASQDQMKILVKNGCIDVICSFLSEEDITTLDNIVSALESILFHGRQIQQEFTYAENPYGHYLEEKRYLERLDSIISKNNFAPNNIVMKIENIINLYIKDETEKI